jgi:hypothetical protein
MYKYLFYKFIKAFKLLKNKNNCIVYRVYLMLSKVNERRLSVYKYLRYERRLSVYKYLHFKKFLSTSTEIIGR